jgi:hypothetical protein
LLAGLESSEDYEFNLRCMYNGLKVGYCNSILAIYRRHGNQKVRTTNTKLQSSIRDEIRNKYNK